MGTKSLENYKFPTDRLSDRKGRIFDRIYVKHLRSSVFWPSYIDRKKLGLRHNMLLKKFGF